MRVRILWLVLTLSAVTLSLHATAAPINIVVSRVGGTTNWSMSLAVDPPYTVGSLAFMTSPAITDFVLNPGNPTVSALDSIFLLDAIGDGRGVLILNTPGPGIAMSGLLGTFRSTTTNPADIRLMEDQDILGPAVYDAVFNPVPSSLWTVQVVPEPRMAVLLALAALACFRKRSNGI